jgi:hypothetical protein
MASIDGSIDAPSDEIFSAGTGAEFPPIYQIEIVHSGESLADFFPPRRRVHSPENGYRDTDERNKFLGS